LFGILNLGHCDLFGICDLLIAYIKLHQFLSRFDRPFFWPAAGLTPYVADNLLLEKARYGPKG